MKRTLPSQQAWVIGLLAGVLCFFGLVVQAQTPTVNLITRQPATIPVGVTLEWHTSLPVSASNIMTMAQTQSATVGVYYAVYNYGGSPVCYSQPTMLRVLTNTCPATTVDLSAAVDPATVPASATITYHSSATASAATEITNTTVTASATETVYYAAYKTYEASTNTYCYSNTVPIVVVLTNCSTPCAVTVTPVLSAASKANVCPVLTVDLSSITAGNTPGSTTLTWHSATPVTAATELPSVTAVAGGVYYAAFKISDGSGVCYGPATAFTAISTTCTVPCNATAAPALSQGSVANSCPEKTVSLTGITGLSLPANTTLSWHSGSVASAANALTALTGLPAGVYYAALKGTGAGCYGPSTAVIASVTNCETILPPVPPATTVCDYATAPATLTYTVSNAPAGYSALYLLVDRVTGLIVQSSATAGSFTAVGQGQYLVTAAWYKGTLMDAVPGKLISGVYENETGCLTYSAYLPVRICSGVCDYASAPATLTFTSSPSPTTGVTTTYVLVDETTNLIVATSQTAAFSTVAKGDYAIAAVYYTGSLTLTPGTSLYDVTTNNDNCQAVSNAIRVRVCSACSITAVPALSMTMVTNLCPAVTADISTITAGNTPSGTTLTWFSTAPGQASTRLTGLTALASGTYYAAFVDQSDPVCIGPLKPVSVLVFICCGIYPGGIAR